MMGSMANDREEIANFLERRDTIHFIVDIGTEPREYAELKDCVSLKESAFANRLKAGRRLDFWTTEIVEDEEGNEQRVYRLAKNGETAFSRLEEMDAVEASIEAREQLEVVRDVRRNMVERLRSEE